LGLHALAAEPGFGELLLELELLQAAVSAARLAATAMAPARQRTDLPLLTLLVDPIDGTPS
jgi:hypothetical protein